MKGQKMQFSQSGQGLPHPGSSLTPVLLACLRTSLGRRAGEHRSPWWLLDQNGCKPLAKMFYWFFLPVNHRKWNKMKIKLNKEGRTAGKSNYEAVATKALHYLSYHIFSWLFNTFISLSILQPRLYPAGLTEHPRSSSKLPSWQCLKRRSLHISYLFCSCIQAELFCSLLPLIAFSRCTHFRFIKRKLPGHWCQQPSLKCMSWQETKHEKKKNPTTTSFLGTTKF